VDRFQARFELATGMCRLFRIAHGGQPKELSHQETAVKGPGTFQVSFANFDERLTLWVNDELPFGHGVEYPSSGEAGPDNTNDLQPASVAAKGKGVTVSHLRLWRDTYYTTGDIHKPDLKTFYIYKNHFLCLGDNSPESSDGRMWGMVPERLMLGRALMVYFPFRFPYWPLNLPANRVGVIH
jgi:signal peptidase I